MKARRCWFLGAATNTCSGASLGENIQALRVPAQPPTLIGCKVFDSIETIPYKLFNGKTVVKQKHCIYPVIDAVVQQAIDEAQLTPSQQQKMALFVGSSSFDISVSEHLYQQELKQGNSALPLRLSSFGNIATCIRQQFSLAGADYSFNTACTASANALMAAANLLRLGVIEHALIVGLEFYNDTTALGFHGLNLLTRSVMKPFDRNRDGLVLGEACSALIMGCDKSQVAGPVPFYFAGGANRCDTYSISAANPDGSTIADVMVQALANAGIAAGEVNAIKAHGTASLSNDESEAAGMLSVFNKMPPVCVLKPFIGHTLGACGLTELILFYRALEQGFLPATPGIGIGDNGPGIELNQQYDAPGNGYFLLNYFGFGGNNSSLVIANG